MGQPHYRQWFYSIGICVMRATMGNRKKDKHFDDFWELAKENNLTRGAYHFIVQTKTNFTSQ
jgi:GH25 family lysozyme M1 (1,4-beta-N-acetylmuramidase)